MSLIPTHKVQEIQSAAQIDVVINEFVPLKKSGASLKGICPWHKGNSFTVTPSKNMYKCFGCGKSGSSITFLMESEGKTFPEALRWLAEKFNVIID